MLQAFRDRLQGWVANIIIALICLTFVLWGVDRFFDKGAGNKQVVAKVNRSKITLGEWHTLYKRMRTQMQSQFGRHAIPVPVVQHMKKQALEELISRTVLIQKADRAGFEVPVEQVNAVIQSMPAFQVSGEFSAQLFNQRLQAMGYHPSGFTRDLQNDLLMEQQRKGIADSAFALPGEVGQAMQVLTQQRDVSFALLPRTRFVSQQKISDAEVAKFYEQHKDAFKTPEQVSLQYVRLSLPAIQKEISVPEEKIESVYKGNMSSYRQPAQVKLAHLLVHKSAQGQPDVALEKAKALSKRLQEGEDFTSLVMSESDDAVSAKTGGVLPWQRQDALEPALRQAITNKKAGEITQPVATRYGYEIVKVMALKPAKIKPLSEVRDRIKARLSAEQAEKVFSNKNEQLANLSYENPEQLQTTAKALGLDIKTTKPFSRNGGKAGIAANANVVATAFTSELLQDRFNSQPVEIGSDDWVVLRVKEHFPAKQLPLSQVQDKIRQQLQQAAAGKAAVKLADKILAEIGNSAAKLPMIADVNQLKWKKPGWVSRRSEVIPASVANKAFALKKPEKGGISSGVVEFPTGDMAVVVVSGIRVEKVSKQQLQEERTALTEQLQSADGELDYALYVRSALAKSKIKRFDAEFAELTGEH